MRIRRGEIYWIKNSEYRNAIGSVQKPGRPGIVVSNDANNSWSNTAEVVYLTTSPKKELPTHCTIESAAETSIALCEQVTTVSTEQLGDYIGHCSDAEMNAVNRCIAISLCLESESKQEAPETADLLTELLRSREREEMITRLYNDLLDRITAR